MSKANEPAYPRLKRLWRLKGVTGKEHDYNAETIGGFTKREAYALAAMQALISSWRESDTAKFPTQTIPERMTMFAHHAFAMADAMLAESEKPHA